MQDASASGSPHPAPAIAPAPGYARLLTVVAADLPAIVAAVARDVAGPDEVLEEVQREVRPAVERLLASLREGPEPGATTVGALRGEGGEAARAGYPVHRAIDRYLSAGWVIWAAAWQRAASSRRGADRAAMGELGTALLRTGDIAAAAIAEGHGSAARQVAGRAATARAELLEELLDGPSGPDASARIGRHASTVGIDPSGAYEVIVASAPAGGPDPDVEAAAATLERPPRPSRRGGRRTAGFVGARDERLVAVLPAGTGDGVAAEAVAAALGREWCAARSTPLVGLAGARAAYLEASGALVAALRLGRTGRILPADTVLVERALLVDEPLLAAMVEHELGPIERAPRGGPELLATLDAWLDSGLNGQETARRLGVAPRTIAYRLARIERITGDRLGGRVAARLSVAMLGRRLLRR
jgi:hypothetical protein